jgi:hypothetical protein
MTIKNITARNAAVDAAISTATIDDTRMAGLAMLTNAGAIAAKAGDAKAKADIASASALDLMVAGLAATGVMTETFEFDVTDRKGDVVEHVGNACLADYATPFLNADGSAYRAKEVAFRIAALRRFLAVKGDTQSAGAKAAWTCYATAYPLAVAIIREGMTATIRANKLAIEGGKGEVADAIHAATGTKAKAKIAKGETGTKGGTDAGKAAKTETRAATPSEICAEAMKVARKVVAGKEALCPAALSTLRALAALVAAHPAAFAD